ncbi:ATP-grasp domain-containing protein [Pseudomonas syringae group genomosp. 3]|uniref:Phosphoribosylglycinamide synthetase n=1 Tax=Pseudomonas syringae pv. primulae TaxID=251707 RepID=A0A3M3Y9U4_9PSED|nr:ATP-grasp domain-containing protein [Pseudomonas syringae group genomosp. 3]RMO78454.1 Phosphoribosylglycinamide synthetase [Pseudomonas syringae pv. primulae]RMU33998.1 hypothetical protein ALP30_200096 [Pseudomonas syringae pv. primulae]
MPALNKKEVVIIVDAWSGGKYLIPAFQALGYFCIHIQSEFVPTVFENDNNLAATRSDVHIVHNGDVEILVGALNIYKVKAIIAGSEGAVSLADNLNEIFGLAFKNSYNLSIARRNKFHMQDRLAQNGLDSINQKIVTNIKELREWLAQNERRPVVLKPVQSAGTDGVFICHGIEDAENALNIILAKKDLFGDANLQVLCQEFLDGEEFVINGIACQGQYFFTELWRSQKKQRDGSPVYDVQYLHYQNDTGFSTLTNYTTKVCQSLGFSNGAFHAEVMITPRGPVLIEIGARVAGGADPYIVEECLGHSQISKLVQAVIHPQIFLRELHQQHDFTGHRRAAYIFMISPNTSKVLRTPEKNLIAIPGVVSVNYHYDVGDIQKVTKDLLSSPGLIIAIQDDKLLLDETIDKIRRVESDFYRLDLELI